ncbi:hypothetical protein BDV96DRAFT_620067 [Lophiotrema nucula]|uniref:Cyclase-domain-containing protein n=1 Tax=Lophiotrema nucula TaxID=690887 RepID=A0A6A5ZKV2_9PLEO|nr:hypothetical protein BDV96DRAFT_620067 [Lophiotrema nucula]
MGINNDLLAVLNIILDELSSSSPAWSTSRLGVRVHSSVHLPLWGEQDELEMLNLTTLEIISAAVHCTRRSTINKVPMAMNDDAIYINTQSSTQGDGFRHYGYQGVRKFYNGHRQEEFTPGSGPLGINIFAQMGGITGRGVLLDWYTWAENNNIHLSPFETGAIKTRPGDIFFIRVGFVVEYDLLTSVQRENLANRQPGGLLGLEATKESLRWLWENQIVAITSDAAAFERGPATGPYNDPDVSIHQWCLAGWGMPIDELFDLDKLANHCQKHQKWTFFMQSMPLKIPGGVASPANAVAIF